MFAVLVDYAVDGYAMGPYNLFPAQIDMEEPIRRGLGQWRILVPTDCYLQFEWAFNLSIAYILR